MATVLRTDFAEESVGLLLPQQKKNVQRLHDWLIDENGMLDQERVLALTNYQQGRFGRMPSHILLVTAQRIAYTHDGGLRSIPLHLVDTTRIGLRVGVGSGDITLVCDGEEITFRRGISLAMQQVATTLSSLPTHRAQAPAPAAPSPQSAAAPPTSAPSPAPSSNTQHGQGDGIVQFQEPVQFIPVAISGNRNGGAFSVWALDTSLAQSELVVNTTDVYTGVCIVGQQGPVAALSVSSQGPWEVTPLEPGDLPNLENGRVQGVGDALVMIKADLSLTDAGMFLSATLHSDRNTALHAFGSNPALLVNQIGPYGGLVVVPPGTQFVAITATGPWTLQRQ